MKGNLTPLVLILSATILAVIFVWPTYKDYDYRKEMSKLAGQDSLNYLEEHQDDILNARLKRIKLGLDLQGGMRVVLEVDLIKLLEDLAKNKDDVFTQALNEVRAEAEAQEINVVTTFLNKLKDKGIRLSRYYGTIRDEDAQIESQLESETDKAIDRAIEIVRNRVDQYRVSEPTIQKQGGRRIIVELPGVKDEREVRQLLQGTARLEFKMLRDPDLAYKLMETIDNYLAGKVTVDTSLAQAGKKPEARKDTTTQQRRDALSELLGSPASTTTTEDTTSEAAFVREHPFFSFVRPDQRGSGEAYVLEKDKERVQRLLDRTDIQRLLPPDAQFLWSAKPIRAQDGTNFFTLFLLKRNPELTGGVITDARASLDPEDNLPVVNMEMNSDGARQWAQITGANVGKRVAIVLDDAVFSAPVIKVRILGGRSQISGLESASESRLLEIILKAGALPAPVQIVEQRVVGPSLGEDSIKAGINSLLMAVIVTILFMILYYSIAGVVANIAVLFNILFILGVLAAFQATFTLPGFAGLVLTIGMAVDANVLVNERVREELTGGKTLRAAIEEGYKKSYSAIFDSNITTFLTGIILYQFGSGPVQGFALTLMIGIASTLFSALVISKFIFTLMTDRGMRPSFG